MGLLLLRKPVSSGGGGFTPIVEANSLEFNGSDETVSFGNNTAYDRTSVWSYSLWIRPASGTSASRVIICKQAGTGEFEGWNILQADAALSMFVINRASTSVNWLNLSVASFFAATTWVHFVATFDGTGTAAGTTIYKNGVAQTPTVVRNDLAGAITTSAPLRLAARGATAAGHWAGRLTGLTFFGKVLGSSEVTELFNAGVSVDPRSLSMAADVDSFAPLGESPDTTESANGIVTYGGSEFTGTAENMTDATNIIANVPS